MSIWLAGVNIRVIDPFTVKPLDAATIVASARATRGKVITVEDHYKEGMQFSGFSVMVLWLNERKLQFLPYSSESMRRY